MGEILVVGVGGVEVTGVLAMEEDEDVSLIGGGDLSSGGDLLSISVGGDLSITLLRVDRNGAGFAVGTELGVEVWDKGGGKYYCNDDTKWHSIYNYTTIK